MAYAPHIIASVRAAHRDRIDAAAARLERARFGNDPRPGIHTSLMCAGAWLARHGCTDDLPCAGETYFNVSMSDYRAFADGADPALLAEILEAGEKAIFQRPHPIWVPLAPAAVEMVRRAA